MSLPVQCLHHALQFTPIFCNSIAPIDNSALNLPILVCNGDANTCEKFHAEVKSYFCDEFEMNIGDQDESPSIDDMNCNSIYEKSVAKLNNRYFVRLSFRDENIVVPKNLDQAKSRLLQQKNL